MSETYTIKINPGCSPDPSSQSCTHGDKLCFFNNTDATLTIAFKVPPGSPLAPPTIGPIHPNQQHCRKVTGDPDTYYFQCAGASTTTDPGIIIVDAKEGEKSKGRRKPKAKPRVKPKSKPRPKSKGKKTKKSTKAPKRKARKASRKK